MTEGLRLEDNVQCSQVTYSVLVELLADMQSISVCKQLTYAKQGLC